MRITEMEATVDGGWSWVVLFCMFWANAIHAMQYMSGTIFYPVLLHVFGKPRAITSWFGSLNLILLYTSGSLGSYLLPRIGARNVLFLSALCTSLAFIAISLSNSLILTILCYGLLGGIGYGLFLTSSIAAVAQHFHRYHFTATSISIVGGGVGALLYGPLLESLVEIYGWRGAALIFAGISLNLAVAASTVFVDQPSKTIQVRTPSKKNPLKDVSCKKSCHCSDKNGSCSSESCVFQGLSDGGTNPEKPDDRCVEHRGCASDGQQPRILTEESDSKRLTIKERFSDSNFWCLVFVAFTSQLAITTYQSILKDLFISAEFAEYFQVSVISAGVCNTLIRILLAFLSFSNVIISYGLVLLFCSVVMFLFSIATKYWMYIVLNSAAGLVFGAVFLMSPTSVGAVYGRKEMSITFGYVLFWAALSNVIGPPIVGYMRDSTGSYTSGLIFIAGVILMGAVVAIILHFKVLRQRRNKMASQVPI